MKAEFVFGGSFDPLHIGHFNLVKEVVTFIENNRPDNLPVFRFLPCAVPALKESTSSRFELRVQSLEKAFSDFFKEKQMKMIVDTREYTNTKNNQNKSYTINSLKELNAEDQSIKRFFILGADNLISFAQWKDYQIIKNYANLLVINRPGFQLNNWQELAKSYGFKVKENNQQLFKTKTILFGECYYLPVPEVDISSSQIREKINKHQPVDQWLA